MDHSVINFMEKEMKNKTLEQVVADLQAGKKSIKQNHSVVLIHHVEMCLIILILSGKLEMLQLNPGFNLVSQIKIFFKNLGFSNTKRVSSDS